MPIPKDAPEPPPRFKYQAHKIGRPRKEYEPTRNELIGLIRVAKMAAKMVKKPSDATIAVIALLDQSTQLLQRHKHINVSSPRKRILPGECPNVP